MNTTKSEPAGAVSTSNYKEIIVTSAKCSAGGGICIISERKLERRVWTESITDGDAEARQVVGGEAMAQGKKCLRDVVVALEHDARLQYNTFFINYCSCEFFFNFLT